LQYILGILSIEADYLGSFEECLLVLSKPESELHLILVAHTRNSIGGVYGVVLALVE
jgi:hypothetical protein